MWLSVLSYRAVLYLLLFSIPIVYGPVYGFNLGEIGLVFTTQIVAAFLGLSENNESFVDSAKIKKLT